MKQRTLLIYFSDILVLRKIIDRIDASKVSRPVAAKDVLTTNHDLLQDHKETTSEITHEWLWPTMGTFFRPKDVIVTETGTHRHHLSNLRDI